MTANGKNLKTSMAFLLMIFVLSIPALALDTGAQNYPMTIDVLTELHAKGFSKWHQLKAYEFQAINENLHGLANLFAAMVASQSVITNQFQRLLADIGADPAMCITPPFTVGMTRGNLRRAIERELLDTDKTFPDALKQVMGEGHSRAIQLLQIAIDVKHHHRENLEKIYSYTGFFFEAFTAKINKHNPRYFICSQTGAVILNTLPVTCPIQGGNTSSYVELVELETPNRLTTCSPPNDVAEVG